ncbi:MAG: GDSL-type esterase/lipase family protein [Verrucomicrobiales bacterium]|nr:GDSL-type esterase/lipase family protein [Verrucomicrobiales bacterium]
MIPKPILAMAVILMTTFVLADEAVKRPKPERWDKAIAKFLEADAKETPPKGAILFVGSSSIRMWDTKEWFPQLETINRGFGGSWTQDVLHHRDKIVVPYAPRTIVLYEGDNDIGGGLRAEAVFGDYVKFAEAVHEKLPETTIIFVAIKPSIKRWALWPEMKKANDFVTKRCESQPLERFLDIAPLLLGADGKPDARFFAKDGLHLSKEGYKAWSDLLRPLLNIPSAEKSS